MAPGLKLTLLPERLAVCRLPPSATLPRWAAGRGFLSVTRTREELSVVVPESRVPHGVRSQRNFRALRVEGALAFSAVGVLASLVVPLARARVSVFSLSTYGTDYILVRQGALRRAVQAWRDAGHRVSEGRPSARNRNPRAVRK